MSKNAWIQGLILIIASTAVAIVANGFASPQRQLKLPGWYPNALKVAPRAAETVAPPVTTTQTAAPTTTVTEAPVTPATATIVPLTTTTAPPATTTTTTIASSPATATAAPIPAPAQAVPDKTPVERFPPHPDKASVEISGDDAAWLYAKGVLFLDARRTSVYEQGHIAGSRPFSVWEADVDSKVEKLYEERSEPVQQNQPIVIYCSGGACEDSHMLAQKLWGLQFNNVYVYKDGFPDWQKRGGAVRTGGQP
jgi:rhodanese-related sulfurtransferase